MPVVVPSPPPESRIIQHAAAAHRLLLHMPAWSWPKSNKPAPFKSRSCFRYALSPHARRHAPELPSFGGDRWPEVGWCDGHVPHVPVPEPVLSMFGGPGRVGFDGQCPGGWRWERTLYRGRRCEQRWVEMVVVCRPSSKFPQGQRSAGPKQLRA